MKLSKLTQTHALLLAAVIIAAGILGAQYMKQSSIERQQRADLAAEASARLAEERKERERQANIDQCLRESFRVYSADWNAHCESIGLELDCMLPSYTANTFEERKERNDQKCYDRY